MNVYLGPEEIVSDIYPPGSIVGAIQRSSVFVASDTQSQCPTRLALRPQPFHTIINL